MQNFLYLPGANGSHAFSFQPLKHNWWQRTSVCVPMVCLHFACGACCFLTQPPLLFHEDNQAMIRVVATGKNPTMRYLVRTHRVSVAWLHDVCQLKRDTDGIRGYEPRVR